MNVASRMEALAESDSILVTQATYDRIRNAYDLDPRGPVEVKGRGKITTYVLIVTKQEESQRSA